MQPVTARRPDQRARPPDPHPAGAPAPEDIYRAKIREIVRRTSREQGVPEKCSDPVVLDRVARLILAAEARAARRAKAP